MVLPEKETRPSRINKKIQSRYPLICTILDEIYLRMEMRNIEHYEQKT